MKPIKIDGISQDPTQYGIKVTIISGKDKYSFFDKKRDGSLTKAMEQFKKYGFSIGQTVNAEVKEEQKQFTNKEGKTVNYTQRTIIYFQEVENTPVMTSAPEKKQEGLNSWQQTVENRLSALEAKADTPPEYPF